MSSAQSYEDFVHTIGAQAWGTSCSRASCVLARCFCPRGASTSCSIGTAATISNAFEPCSARRSRKCHRRFFSVYRFHRAICSLIELETCTVRMSLSPYIVLTARLRTFLGRRAPFPPHHPLHQPSLAA